MAKNETTNPMYFDASAQEWTGNLDYDQSQEPDRGYPRYPFDTSSQEQERKVDGRRLAIKALGGKTYPLNSAPATDAELDAYTTKNTGQKLYVDRIVLNSAGTGGDYEVQEGNGGVSLTGVVALGADETQTINVGRYVSDLYIKQFGSDGSILVYHGNPSNR